SVLRARMVASIPAPRHARQRNQRVVAGVWFGYPQDSGRSCVSQRRKKPMSIQERNRELADRINAEARSDPQSPYANKFVGIANGQVVVVADDPDEMSRRLRQIEPDPSKCFGVEASRDYSVVEEIWRLP